LFHLKPIFAADERRLTPIKTDKTLFDLDCLLKKQCAASYLSWLNSQIQNEMPSAFIGVNLRLSAVKKLFCLNQRSHTFIR
jgi:hypothetical protein